MTRRISFRWKIGLTAMLIALGAAFAIAGLWLLGLLAA